MEKDNLIYVTDFEGMKWLVESLDDFRECLFENRKIYGHSNRWTNAKEISEYIVELLEVQSIKNEFKLLLLNQDMLSKLATVISSEKFDSEFLSIKDDETNVKKYQFLTSLRGSLKILTTENLNELALGTEDYLDMIDLFERGLKIIYETVDDSE